MGAFAENIPGETVRASEFFGETCFAAPGWVLLKEDFIRRYLVLCRWILVGSCGLPALVWIYNLLKPGLKPEPAGLAAKLMGAAAVGALALWLTGPAYKRWGPHLRDLSAKQTQALDEISDRWVGPAIVASAAVSLALQLVLIRWQGSVFEIFSIYKNFGLLACFTGLGLGYGQSNRRQIPLVLAAPLIAWQFLILLFTRYDPVGWDPGILRSIPVLEELAMGMENARDLHDWFGAVLLLGVTFVLTALAFLPIGQLCGALLLRRPKLAAYGLNLTGSIVGVAVTLVLSFMWTPPVVWFTLCFATLLPFLLFDRRAMATGGIAMLLSMVILAWPVNFPWTPTYSPYQILERGPEPGTGLTRLLAAGQYFQRIYDLTPARVNAPGNGALKRAARYYEFPYVAAGPRKKIAIVGAGTGNDVAAALRQGVSHIDAIEIDPAIVQFGRVYHPERPYSDPKVRTVVNDARTFLRQTGEQYDMVVYGLLDSHTLLGTSSNVRLDSFVYTTDAFREARARLTDDGVFSLSFCVLTPELGRKFYLMLKEAFDGVEPLCVEARYDRSIIFLLEKDGKLSVSEEMLAASGFKNVTAAFADPALKADPSTDDWPFVYVPRKTFPFSYLVVMGMLLAVAVGLTRKLADVEPGPDSARFVLLGAGFMLVETRSITMLGLNFGNTWQVIGIVILGILSMACLANLLVQRVQVRDLTVPYFLLMATLGVGLFAASKGGFPSTPGGKLAALLVLTSPLFFSGIVFSTLLENTRHIASALAANLVGAMVGGVLEYLSMYFGFTFLYWLALAMYGAAFLIGLARPKPVSAPASG